MLKEITILVGKKQVTGMLDAETKSITVQIQSPFQNLKSGAYQINVGWDGPRYVHSGKLSASALESGEEILKALYLAGQYLRHHPELIGRLLKYNLRFERHAKAIRQERKGLLGRLNAGELPQREYARQENVQLLAERRNVLERASVFRYCAKELEQQSGGRADIDSILRFNLPSAACLAHRTQQS